MQTNEFMGQQGQPRVQSDGSVMQRQAQCFRNEINEETGKAKVDSSAYRCVMQDEIQSIDEKFMYGNQFLNKYGSKKHYKNRQKAMIKVISANPRASTCESAYIGADDIIINNISFGNGAGYGDRNYYSLLDSFNFYDFFNKFRGIRVLQLDGEAYSMLHQQDQLGYGALELVFKMEPMLKWIAFPNLGNGEMRKVTRELASRANYIKGEESRCKADEEAERVLEESFLWGGPINKGNTNGIGNVAPVLKKNAKNNSRARRVSSSSYFGSKARQRANSLMKRPIGQRVAGAGISALKVATKPLISVFKIINKARTGDF